MKAAGPPGGSFELSCSSVWNVPMSPLRSLSFLPTTSPRIDCNTNDWAIVPGSYSNTLIRVEQI